MVKKVKRSKVALKSGPLFPGHKKYEKIQVFLFFCPPFQERSAHYEHLQLIDTLG
jgi:hypothetical protein